MRRSPRAGPYRLRLQTTPYACQFGRLASTSSVGAWTPCAASPRPLTPWARNRGDFDAVRGGRTVPPPATSPVSRRVVRGYANLGARSFVLDPSFLVLLARLGECPLGLEKQLACLDDAVPLRCWCCQIYRLLRTGAVRDHGRRPLSGSDASEELPPSSPKLSILRHAATAPAGGARGRDRAELEGLDRGAAPCGAASSATAAGKPPDLPGRTPGPPRTSGSVPTTRRSSPVPSSRAT